MIKENLNFLWSGKDFKTKNYYLPTDPHIIRMTYGEAQLLSKYCQKAKKGILEIGRFFGGSTYFIVNSSPENIPVLSVDIKNHIKIYSTPKDVPHTIGALKKTYASEDYNKVVDYINEAQKNKKLTLLNIDSKNLKLKDEYDVVFIDGDHSYEGVQNDVEKVLIPSTKYIILHDYFQPDVSVWPYTIPEEELNPKKTIYGVKKYVDEIVKKGICKIIEQTHIMVVLKYIK